MSRNRRTAVWLLVAGLLVAVYPVVAVLVWANRGWADDGPLSFERPAATVALDESTSLDTVKSRCAKTGSFLDDDGYTTKVVAARIDGVPYYACYLVRDRNGSVFDAVVIDAQGIAAPTSVVKAAGAWRWIGYVKTPTELVLAGAALVVFLLLHFRYYRRARPGPPVPARWWQTQLASLVLGVFSVLPLTLPFRRRESRARRVRLFFQWVFGLAAVAEVSFLIAGAGDLITTGTLGVMVAGLAWGWLGGRTLLAPAGFGAPDNATEPATAAQGPYAVMPYEPPAPPSTRPWQPPVGPATGPVGSPAAGPPVGPLPPATGQQPAGRRTAAPIVRTQPAAELATFADVGGMDALKAELADTFGLLLAFSGEADTYRVQVNGVLLHGPPGVGKTFLAKATAGEFGLGFLHVSTSDLISAYVGESSKNLRQIFSEAAVSVPVVLFFDEFDAIAERREDGINEESKRVVTQLLQSLEEWRPVRELVVMAATNHLDKLDPAVIRPGRFDRHVRVDLPDLPARRAILAAQLRRRPVAPDVDLDDLARRTAGRTPAVITRVVEAAALAAFREHTGSGRETPITTERLRAALAGLGGTDRPTVEDWSWDRLVLADEVKAELRQIQALVADPERAGRYGVQMPSGLLLAGPPGTGKTTVARVFAAQAGCSFYPVTAADLTSKWVGESEASVVRLFARARDNAPSIVFIDEIDAIASARSEMGSSVLDRTLTQLLTELDGMTEQRGVFVVAATNRPEVLDPALLRPGRLSRVITIPLPDRAQRRTLLGLFTATMPLAGVDLGALAGETDGLSGADLEALCQQAALRAMVDGSPDVTAAAFAGALADRRAGSREPADPGPAPGQYL